MGPNHPHENPSKWVCFLAPYSHIRVRTIEAPPPPPGIVTPVGSYPPIRYCLISATGTQRIQAFSSFVQIGPKESVNITKIHKMNVLLCTINCVLCR